MEAILLKAASLMMIIFIGYSIKRLGWVSARDFPIFSNIVLRITLPCALAVSFDSFTLTPAIVFLAVLAFGANLIQEGSGYFVDRRHGRQAQAFGVLNVGGYNVGLFATPYLAGLIGHQAIAYALIFDVGNSLAAGGVAYAWSSSLSRPDQKMSIWRFVRQILRSPIFDTYIVLMLLNVFNLHLPRVVISFATVAGNANTFLAMLMIGIGLEVSLPRAKYAAAFRYLRLRYALAVAFALTMWFLIPADPMIKMILAMLLFAPIPSMASAFTAEAGGDVELSTFMTSVSILIGIVTMPLLQLALSH